MSKNIIIVKEKGGRNVTLFLFQEKQNYYDLSHGIPWTKKLHLKQLKL